MSNSKAKLKKMVLVSLFAAVMCIFAPFTVPIGVVPLSLSTFVLYLTSVILGKSSVFSIIVYIIIGAVGLPVFSGGVGGIERIFGPTGGFIMGYIPCAIIAGIFVDSFSGKKLMYFAGVFIGTVAMYIPGIFWMLHVLGADSINSSISVLMVNVLPFVPVDIIKMFIAVLFGTNIKKRLTKRI